MRVEGERWRVKGGGELLKEALGQSESERERHTHTHTHREREIDTEALPFARPPEVQRDLFKVWRFTPGRFLAGNAFHQQKKNRD